ncbi:hypothetical protein D5086_004731 [Populus alba]|uniref:Uncharacterized protein n=1 Tax=Populus alba TaxID=43335 RepID=A0ACC4CSL8_POPAL
MSLFSLYPEVIPSGWANRHFRTLEKKDVILRMKENTTFDDQYVQRMMGGKVTLPSDTATAAAALAPATITGAVMNFGSKIPRRTNKVVDIVGMNPYGGLKASNSVLALSMPVSIEQCFAKVVGSLRAASNTHGRGGGALSSKCSDAGESSISPF